MQKQNFSKRLRHIHRSNNQLFLLVLNAYAFVFMTACVSEPPSRKQPQTETSEKVAAPSQQINIDTVAKKELSDSVNYIELQFSDVSIFVEEMEMGWDDKYVTGNDTIYKVKSDTAFLDVFIGDWFFDKRFYIPPSEFDQVRLFEKSIDHIAVSSEQTMEVPFCVLTSLREWESEWSEVSLEEGYKFSSENKTTEVEIDFSIEEVRDAVGENCGERWVEEFTEYATLKEMGYEIFTSQIIFKMVLTNSVTGNEVEKLIVFYTPTSC